VRRHREETSNGAVRPLAVFRLVLCLLIVALLGSQLHAQELPPAEKLHLAEYLKAHWQSSEDYVVSKFAQYDIVFIGEFHRIRHDPLLIQALIPRLYKAGVHNLGIEFGVYDDQAQVDRLLTADKYDENAARQLIFHHNPAWGYKEYIDIYHAAWELNHSLPKDAPKFRVVNLNYAGHWQALTGERTPEVMRKVWYKGDPDEYMAQVVLHEFVRRGQKALVYSGKHHAFTRYRQPRYNFEEKKFYGFGEPRMGNLVYEQIPAKVFNIVLHSPWPSKRSYNDLALPVKGAIDQVMQGFKDQRVGFDVKGSPFGLLPDSDTYYAVGYEHFTLETLSDGYIFLGPMNEYEGCTVDPLFVTDQNFTEAVAQLDDPEERKQVKTPADLIRLMQEDADIPRTFRALRQ